MIDSLRFNDDGSKVAVALNAYNSPSDVWSFEVKGQKLTRWTASEIGGLNADNFAKPELIRYPSDDVTVPAWVYRPKNRPADGAKTPVVVSIHGGPASQHRPRFNPSVQAWAGELGVAVVAPNVRGSSGYGKTWMGLDNGFNRKRSVEDIGALLDWIATQPDLDPDRVLLYGGSYGGYMVLASMIDY
ncbi:MAG: S9 family peptidase, partial [Actinomycetia bacterium]|nr:S9 family peptidase [Actinomycetes bacterium]